MCSWFSSKRRLNPCTGILVALAVLAASLSPEQAVQTAAPKGMVYVGGGSYEALYADPSRTEGEIVAPFFLSRYPVTNADFLDFVRENPEWRRSSARSLFVDSGYLSHWEGDLDYGPETAARQPVVNVSWFAARAYADWKGMRLPTTAEWELAATASAGSPDGNDIDARQEILAWYSKPATGGLEQVGSTSCNYWGACDLHGLIWEWVDDFNSALVTGESRNNSELDLTLFCGSAAVGATSFDDYTAFLRFAFRSGLKARYTVASLGFRLAQDAENPNA